MRALHLRHPKENLLHKASLSQLKTKLLDNLVIRVYLDKMLDKAKTNLLAAVLDNNHLVVLDKAKTHILPEVLDKAKTNLLAAVLDNNHLVVLDNNHLVVLDKAKTNLLAAVLDKAKTKAVIH